MKRWKIAVVAAAALAAGLWLGGAGHGLDCTMVSGNDPLSVATAQLAPNSVKFFCYDDRGARIRFLLARDPRGRIYSVLDACSQCYRFHKGFEFKDGFLVCRFCGNRYRLDRITTGEGSCVPIKLASRVHSGAVEIKAADLKSNRWLF